VNNRTAAMRRFFKPIEIPSHSSWIPQQDASFGSLVVILLKGGAGRFFSFKAEQTRAGFLD
jgi:hypothetical protein